MCFLDEIPKWLAPYPFSKWACWNAGSLKWCLHTMVSFCYCPVWGSQEKVFHVSSMPGHWQSYPLHVTVRHRASDINEWIFKNKFEEPSSWKKIGLNKKDICCCKTGLAVDSHSLSMTSTMNNFVAIFISHTVLSVCPLLSCHSVSRQLSYHQI